jgi:hypothetical protein
MKTEERLVNAPLKTNLWLAGLFRIVFDELATLCPSP